MRLVTQGYQCVLSKEVKSGESGLLPLWNAIAVAAILTAIYCTSGLFIAKTWSRKDNTHTEKKFLLRPEMKK